MRRLRQLDHLRFDHPIQNVYGAVGCDDGGVFSVSFNGNDLRIIASISRGWDHLSVSLADRTPTWAEMEHVKRLFFQPTEAAMQLHVPTSDHVNTHPNCLHLWRPLKAPLPLPPRDMV